MASFKWYLVYFLRTTVQLYDAVLALGRPDLIHCNDLETLLPGVLLKKRLGCPLVYDAHEFWPHSDPEAAWWEVRFWLWLEKRLLPYVDAAFTVNPLLAGEMERAYGKPFGSVPNCEPLEGLADRLPAAALHVGAPADDAPAAPRPGPLPVGAGSPKSSSGGPVRFLYQGLFAPQRGLEELIGAWESVDPRQAALILRGPDNPYKEQCMALAGKLGLVQKSVFFPAAVPESQLLAAAAEADVGVIPYKPGNINYRFCCPNKLSQYMLAGLAILSNDLDFVRDVIQRYQCGVWYNSKGEQFILEAVRRLSEDRGFLSKCRQNAQAKALQEFHWERQAVGLYEAYDRLTGRSGAAG
jgi:glycosyltransferase involved in cell wall biosynthesis